MCTGLLAIDAPTIKAELRSVKKIWEQAPHNAFTDLIRFRNRWYCVFREGTGHAEGEGKLRVLTSTDGEQWEAVALIAELGRDLRDAKLSITPAGQLMLNGGSADPLDHGPKGSFYSVVSFSQDGRNWSALQRVQHKNPADNRYWLWRVIWHKGTAYGVAYMTAPDSPANRRVFNAFVCRSKDGINYERLTDFLPGLTEAALTFERNDQLTILARGSDAQPKAVVLQARAPYTEWKRAELTADVGDDQIGGPALLDQASYALPNGWLIGAGRRFSDKPAKERRTSLFLVDPAKGALTNLLLFESGGDTSYPGLVFHRGVLWLSYYSSHEGKSAIYLAKIKLIKQ
jgi:hypothetical protein